jgi:hypothetical protein
MAISCTCTCGRTSYIHACIQSPAAEVESREKRVRGLICRKAGNLDSYLKGVEGTILVLRRWAVPDRPSASWYRTHLSAWASHCYFCIRYQASCYAGLL